MSVFRERQEPQHLHSIRRRFHSRMCIVADDLSSLAGVRVKFILHSFFSFFSDNASDTLEDKKSSSVIIATRATVFETDDSWKSLLKSCFSEY